MLDVRTFDPKSVTFFWDTLDPEKQAEIQRDFSTKQLEALKRVVAGYDADCALGICSCLESPCKVCGSPGCVWDKRIFPLSHDLACARCHAETQISWRASQ